MTGAVCAKSEDAVVSASAARIGDFMNSVSELVDFGLERGKFGLQLVHFAVARLRVGLLAREGSARILAHPHVSLGHVGKDVAAEGILDRALIALERVHRGLEI